jgi:signal transduction histidine kinase
MTLENLNRPIEHKILWLDDDPGTLQSAARLFRNRPWTITFTSTAEDARDLLVRETFAVVVADQRLQVSSGLDVLEFAKEKSPSTARILLTGLIDSNVLEEAVNRGHVFRFIAKPWENEQLILDISKAIEHHRLRITEASLLKELGRQNRRLELFTTGLEQLVAERTLTAEASKIEAEKKLSHVRELVRFIKDLSMLSSVDELIQLMRKELKGFHELRAPILGYIVSDRRPVILFFQSKQLIEREARHVWSMSPGLRMNEIEDRIYLANEFGRPFVKTIAIPLASAFKRPEVPAILFFEHALPEGSVEPFLEFISERIQPLSIALDRIFLEYSLKYTSLQWESTFDGIKDPIAIIDIDYNIVRANRHFGMGSISTSSCHRVFGKTSDVCRGCPVAGALRTGAPQSGLIRREHRSYDVHSYPIRLRGDSISTIVINHYVDVSESRELHGRMVQSEKMAAIGLLAGNIAHELNNPLTGIRSLAQVLLSELPMGQLKEDMHEVEKAAERSQKIIENLLDFSKGEGEEKQQVISMNEIVHRTLPMIKTAMREHRSEVNLCDETPPLPRALVRVEPHLMQQVVFNLVNNACQAMTNSGTITIETEIILNSAGRRSCALHVKDTGVGIAPEIIESIFEPFFTTKDRGKGTGLGLSMSRSIIKKFGGEILVKSIPQMGTDFSVLLPIVERDPDEPG